MEQVKNKIKIPTKEYVIETTSIFDTISYFENRVAGARGPEHKIRPMQQLITIIICNIIKKHCV